MGGNFFTWTKFIGENSELLFPVDAMDEIFLLDFEKEIVWLSQKCAELLFEADEKVCDKVS